MNLTKKYGRETIALLLDDLASDMPNRELARKWDMHVVDVAYYRKNFEVLYQEYRATQLRLILGKVA